MASSVAQRSLGASLGEKKKLNTLPIVQSDNARHSKHLFTNQQKTISKFSQLLSLRGKEHKNVEKKSKEPWKIWCIDDGSCWMTPQGPSVSELVKEFCNAMNEKNPEKLSQLLSEDCVFQDIIFYIPFGGKKTIVDYLLRVMDAMGPNIHIVTTSVEEGENLTASVVWDLVWSHNKRSYPIPFTAGYTFFNCEQVDGKLIIRKITGVEELPVKPVDLLLKLLKAISTVFDRFPAATEGLLQKSHTSHDGLVMLLDMLGAYRKH